MKVLFDQQQITAGRKNQQEADEQPLVFGRMDEAAVSGMNKNLDETSNRMAGREGARALQMLANPEEQARTQRWMEMFASTDYGDQNWFGGQRAMMRQAEMSAAMNPPAA